MDFLDLFYALPTWLSGTLVVALTMALSVSALLLIRRTVSLIVLKGNHEVAGFLIGVVGVIYAVPLAFMVLTVWEGYQDADRYSDQEANSLGDLYRDSWGFPNPIRQQIQARIVSYAEVVMTDGWDAMRQGKVSTRSWDAFEDLRKIYLEVNPNTSQMNALYQESLARLDDVSDYRRLRLLSSQEDLPHVLWIALLFGGMATIGCTFFFGMENARAHMILTAIVSGLIALLLVTILALDHPFRGDVLVTPHGFEEMLSRVQMMQLTPGNSGQ